MLIRKKNHCDTHHKIMIAYISFSSSAPVKTSVQAYLVGIPSFLGKDTNLMRMSSFSMATIAMFSDEESTLRYQNFKILFHIFSHVVR